MTPTAPQNRGEQSDARARRSRADLQLTINRRRPVIGDVTSEKIMKTIDERDDLQLTAYILNYYGQFASEFENDVLLALNLDAKTIQSESPIMKRKLGEERDRIIERITNPQVVAMIANGRDHCRKQIRERIMRDNDSSIDLNTCTKCGRLARTPDAKMCVQCGHTWYDRNKDVTIPCT